MVGVRGLLRWMEWRLRSRASIASVAFNCGSSTQYDRGNAPVAALARQDSSPNCCMHMLIFLTIFLKKRELLCVPVSLPARQKPRKRGGRFCYTKGVRFWFQMLSPCEFIEIACDVLATVVLPRMLGFDVLGNVDASDLAAGHGMLSVASTRRREMFRLLFVFVFCRSCLLWHPTICSTNLAARIYVSNLHDNA